MAAHRRGADTPTEPLVVPTSPPDEQRLRGTRNATFRFRRLGDRVLLTNDWGRWEMVSAGKFETIVKGDLGPDEPLRQRLAQKGFLLDEMDVEEAIRRYRQRHSFVGRAPYLHIVVTTLRCNESCSYCHASREPMSNKSVDMGIATAKQVVDRIFESTSPQLAIEFQGGEPLVNFDTVRFIVEYATERNREERRDLQLLLVTNLAAMDEDKLEFLLAHDVLLCTSLDGPRELHDAQRKLKGGSAYDQTMHWIERINERYAEMGRDPNLWHVDALLTTTRQSFGHARAIIDEYVRLGIKTIHVRPLNPMGFATRTWEKIGYTPQEFNAFWEECLGIIVDLNRRGTEIIERGAALFLARMLTDEDHGYVDLRSPCGAGIGQVAYDHTGLIYPCDEARMVARMGDDLFELGDVTRCSMADVVGHETVRAIGVASCIEALPGCQDCAYQPYCGVCPVVNYVAQGDLFGHRPTSDRCQLNLLAMDALFGILDREDEEVCRIFERWTVQKARTGGTGLEP